MSKAVSPGSALLRASRLFSIPAPLPGPPGDVSYATHFNSETATTPFPQHQVLTTPNSSRKRGDWGLKRPLPLRSTTKTSTPMIRVKEVDAIEQVTDFASGADHGLTLQKWQGLNMPITIPGRDRTSVFERDHDFTVVDEAQKKELKDKRWRFSGPWLAGMTEGEFNDYLDNDVRWKRREFRDFLRKHIATERAAAVRAAKLDAGEEAAAEDGAVDPATITEEDLTQYIRELRVDRPRLQNLVTEFLDLAPLHRESDYLFSMGGGKSSKAAMEITRGNPYAKEGPPMTHPSAGISYLRTASFLENHPIYGPQRNHPPVKGRIVQPQKGSQGVQLGVAGFLADATHVQGWHQRDSSARADFVRLDPEVAGGAKVYVTPQSARVTSAGKVLLNIGKPRPEDEVVAKEMVGEAKIFVDQAELQEVRGSDDFLRKLKSPHIEPRRMGNSQRVTGSKESYLGDNYV